MIIANKSDYEKMDFCIGETPVLDNSKIVSESNNNKIFCEHGVILKNSTITFVGEGNLVYLSSNCHSYNLNLRIYKDSCFFMDENNYMNGQLAVLVQEHQNVLIGRNGVFSYGIHIMTSDAHLIYRVKDKVRINESKSVCIGDHVWVGQYASIFKGTTIGSGSIIGGTSTITGKACPSNTIWAGNPARQIKEAIFWEKDCPNLYSLHETEESKICKKESAVFEQDDKNLDFRMLDEQLIGCREDIFEKLRIINTIRNNLEKNRFWI